MEILNTIIIWGCSIFLFLIFYKSLTQKLRNVFSLYKTISEYRFLRDEIISMIITSILVTIDFIICISIIIPNFRFYGSICGIVIQLIYFFSMIINYNKHFNNNCGCFIINVPIHINFKSTMLNILILFLFSIILILLSF